jgi:hypothetical protein
MLPPFPFYASTFKYVLLRVPLTAKNDIFKCLKGEKFLPIFLFSQKTADNFEKVFSTLVGSAKWYTTHVSSTVLTTVQHFRIQCCCDNTRKVRAPNAVRRSGAPYMYWPHKKYKFYMKTPFSQLNLSSVEHV